MMHTGIDLSRYSMAELEVIKGIFEHEFEVIGRKDDGTMICRRKPKGGGQLAISDLERVKAQRQLVF